MLIDIVILPPASQRRMIGAQMRKAAKGFVNEYIVDDVRRIPHLSLWHLRTTRSRLDGLTRALHEAVIGFKPIAVRSRKLAVSKGTLPVVHFGVPRSTRLILLQQRVFKTVHAFKTGIMPSFGRPFVGMDLVQAQKYGRPLGFRPHFTMGVFFRKYDARQVAQRMRRTTFNFLAEGVYVCEVDAWWQVTKIIKKIDFLAIMRSRNNKKIA